MCATASDCSIAAKTPSWPAPASNNPSIWSANISRCSGVNVAAASECVRASRTESALGGSSSCCALFRSLKTAMLLGFGQPFKQLPRFGVRQDLLQSFRSLGLPNSVVGWSRQNIGHGERCVRYRRFEPRIGVIIPGVREDYPQGAFLTLDAAALVAAAGVGVTVISAAAGRRRRWGPTVPPPSAAAAVPFIVVIILCAAALVGAALVAAALVAAAGGASLEPRAVAASAFRPPPPEVIVAAALVAAALVAAALVAAAGCRRRGASASAQPPSAAYALG